jgi:flagellar FliL protein
MSAQPPLKDKQPPETEATVKKSKKWLWIILILLLICGGGAATWFFFFNPDEAAKAEPDPKTEKHEPIKPPVFVDLAPFTVNLQPEGQFLQATFVLQVDDEKETELLKLYMPQLRSRLLMMLSSKLATDLSHQEGKTTLIEEIKNLAEQPFAPGVEAIKIQNVFITAFIIQ